MYSQLIISSDKNQREQYALQICTVQEIDPFDRTIVEPEQSLGIEDIRTILKKIYLKPFKSKQKAVILHNAHAATTETQNALLKILEEPPANTLIILTAANESAFLPTILSRCKVILLENSNEELSPEQLATLQNNFQELISSSIGYKLKLAQDIAKDKEKAIEWLQGMIKTVRLTMLEELDKQEQSVTYYIYILQQLQKACTTASSTNVNLRFLLENVFLSISLTS